MAVSASERTRSRFVGQSLGARVVSGLALAALAVWAGWTGGILFNTCLVLALGVALAEFLQLCHRDGIQVDRFSGMVGGLGLLVTVLMGPELSGALVLGAGLWLVARSLRPPIGGRLAGMALTVFAVVYVIGLGLHLFLLRGLPDGRGLVLVVLLATWAADTGAFFVGVRWGRRPLAPHLSPGKSVEGFFGGLTAAVAVVLLVAPHLTPGRSLIQMGVAGVLLGIACPLGDLLESLVKRNLSAKDASRAIPGHGGVLDRIDSVLLAAPVTYYLFRFVWP